MVVTVVIAVVPRVTKALKSVKERRASMRETNAVQAEQRGEQHKARSAGGERHVSTTAERGRQMRNVPAQRGRPP